MKHTDQVDEARARISALELTEEEKSFLLDGDWTNPEHWDWLATASVEELRDYVNECTR